MNTHFMKILTLGLLLVGLASTAGASEEMPVLVDLEPPRITFVQPLDGTTIIQAHPLIEVHISDEESGVEAEAIIISVNGVDVTASATVKPINAGELGSTKEWRVLYQPSLALSPGQQLVQIHATDRAGNVRQQHGCFVLEIAKSKVSCDASLNNTLSFDCLPLRRFRNTSNLTYYLQLPEQRFTLQLRTSATNRPGILTKPNFGDYYLYRDQYTLSWQTQWFTLQHGNINLPFESGLLRFGLGFKGSHLTSNASPSQGSEWSVFRGTTVSSLGLGMSVMETTGGIYRWHKGASKNQIYLLQLGKNGIKVVGLRDERAFQHGILHTELIYGYGRGEEAGAGIRVQGATTIANIFWDADVILLQDSYPVASLSPLSSVQGGAYQYALRGSKLLPREKRLDLRYSHFADNLNGSRAQANKSQSLQVGLSGLFTPDCGWYLGYQGSRRESYSRSQQHTITLRVQQKRDSSSWNSSVILGLSGENNARRYQWNFGHNTPVNKIGKKTASSLQYSWEGNGGPKHTGNLKLRVQGEKDWFKGRVNSVLIATYQHRNEKDSSSDVTENKTLGLEGSLNFRVGIHNAVKVNGKVSFWEKTSTTSNRGIDYSLGLSWQSRVF